MKLRASIFLGALVLFGPVLFAVSEPVPVSRVEAVGFTVTNMERSVEFFTHVLHFRQVSDHECAGAELDDLKGVFGARVRVVRLQLGREQLELTEYIASSGRPIPTDFASNDLSFQHVAIVVRNMDEAYRWLRQNRVRHVSTGPQTLPNWNPNAGGIQAFYFKDPDGHVLELIHFPAGKGDPRWQQSGEDLFQGIDHTAIAVSDTDASLAFYRDLLGMRIAGTSENYGVEQEHLNNVFGARLRITSLRAPEGPGVELLEYLTPRNGRRIIGDAKANDVLHWETVVDEPDAVSAWSRLTADHVRLISSAVVKVHGDGAPERSAFLFADPDGHVLEAVQ